jgi:hypothetical protein
MPIRTAVETLLRLVRPKWLSAMGAGLSCPVRPGLSGFQRSVNPDQCFMKPPTSRFPQPLDRSDLITFTY